jgi:hypothetical protein
MTMWREALLDRDVWMRALRIGLPVGVLQVAVNQGDHWLAGHVTGGVIVKSIAAPAISIGIALVAAAATVRSKTSQTPPLS